MPEETVPEVATTEGALAAINEALDPTPPADTTPEAEAPPEETPPEGDTEPEGDEEGEALEGEEAEAAVAAGRERNPDGTFKKATPKSEQEAKTEAKPPEAKKSDPLNDPIPKELKAETQERIRSLIDTAKTATQDLNYMVAGVQATGASPEQYAETLSWLALFNSNDPAQQAQALELVENVAERLATLLGKERSVGDPLNAHADLKDAVARGQITAQYAKEIARTRNGQQFRTELTTNAQREQQTQQEQQQAVQTARNELSALEQRLQASDPHYEAKKAILVPALRDVINALPPAQWASKFESAYRNLPYTPSTPAPARPAVPANQPLRAGKSPSGSTTKAPSSGFDAITQALASM